MKNLTVSLKENVALWARVWAAKHNTSVSRMLGDFLEEKMEEEEGYQLAMEETHAEEHLELLRTAIEEYRKLFIEWIKGFDPNQKFDDGWGIFTD